MTDPASRVGPARPGDAGRPEPSLGRPTWPRYTVALVLGAVLLAVVHHTVLARAGTVDDAAISYTFAEQWAAGAPVGTFAVGRPIVEGYSNPTWVALLALGVRAGVAVETTAFVFSLLALVGSVLLVARITVRGGARYPPWSAGLAAASTTVVFWAATGLENALVGFLLLVAATALIAEERRNLQGWRSLGSAAALVVLALSRPDTVVFVAVGVAARSASVWRSRGDTAARRRALASAALWLVVTAVPIALFLWWRIATFGVPLPNSVYAKVDSLGSVARAVGWLQPGNPAQQYLATYLTSHAGLVLAALGAVGAWSVRRRPERWLAALWLVSLILPLSEPDWMNNSRFFASFALLSAALVQFGVERLLRWPTRADRRPAMVVASITVLLAFVAVNLRVSQKEAAGRLPSQITTALIGSLHQPFDGDMEAFGLRDPLVMVPDLGWTSWRRGWQILDSAGLLDPQVAHSTGNADALQAYAFDEERPLLLHTHDFLGRQWRIDAAQLRADGYLPVRLVQRDPLVGQFVRRDVVVRPLTGGGREALDAAGHWRLDHVDVTTIAEPGGTIAVDAVTVTDAAAAATGPAVARLEVRGPLAGGAAASTPMGFGIAGPTELRPNEGLRTRVNLDVPTDTEPGRYPLELRALDDAGRSVGDAIKIEIEVQDPSRELRPPTPWTPDTVTPRGSPGWDEVGALLRANPGRAEVLRAEARRVGDDARARGIEAIRSVVTNDPRQAATEADLVNRWRGDQQPDGDERRLAAELAAEAATLPPDSARWVLVAVVRLDPHDTKSALALAEVRRQVAAGRADPH